MAKKPSQTKYVGKATAEQIAGWKKEHGADRVFAVEIRIGPTEVSVSYYRKPNRVHIARAMSYVMQNQSIEAGESVLDNTFLGGDPRVQSLDDADTEFRVAAAWQLYENTKVLEASLKNV